jgi:hypothetical protein
VQQVTTDAEQLIQEAKLNKFHGALLLWGAILMLLDGYDLTIYGAVVPFLMKSWKVSAVETGMIGSKKCSRLVLYCGCDNDYHPRICKKYGTVILIGSHCRGSHHWNTKPCQFLCISILSSSIRSTDLGWTLGIGRIGGIIGPTLGRILLASSLKLQLNFLAFAINKEANT